MAKRGYRQMHVVLLHRTLFKRGDYPDFLMDLAGCEIRRVLGWVLISV